MTVRERMLAVVRGEELDKVPFAVYDGVIDAPKEEVFSLLGQDEVGLLRWVKVHRMAAPNCSTQRDEFVCDGRPGIRTTIHTPAGTLVEERALVPGLNVSAIRRHFVRSADDYPALIAYLSDLVVLEDMAELHRAQEELGDRGLPHVAVERTPFQQMWIEWVSLEDLCLHMVDCPEQVHECFSLIGRNMRRIFEIVRRVPAPYVVFPDNITAPAIGERYFRDYCVPYYDELADMLSDRRVPVYVHMDGDLKPLWSAIAGSRVGGIDSLSPPPDNDTGAGAAATLWPAMRLGVNFPSSVHLAAPETVHKAALDILSEAGHTGRLQIQVSENTPPGAWRSSLPQIVRAINEFGKP